MKCIFTIAKKHVFNNVITHVTSDEIIIENVARFDFDESKQCITTFNNDETKDEILLYKPEDNQFEQWFLADVKCFQVPLNIKI